ncbi:TolC family protein, partial [Poseidonibacter ostreae]
MKKSVNKKIISLSLRLGVLLFGATQLGAISINEAVQAAVQNHPLVQAAKQEVLSSAQKIEIAKGGYYPTLDVSANFGDENSKTKGKNDTSYTKKDYKGGTHLEAVAVQNIFNGFKDTSSVAKSKAEYKTSQYAQNIDVEKLSFDVINTYLEIIKLRETIKFEKISIAKYEEYYTLTQKKLNATGQKSEPFTVKSKLQKAKSDYINLTWKLKRENEKFLQLTGIAADDNMSAQMLSLVKEMSLDDLLISLKSKNSELNQYLSKIKAKKAEVKLGKAAYYPKLDFELKAYKDEDIEAFETKTEQASAMFKLKYNLFNGLKDSSSIEKARVERLKLKSEYDKKNIEQIEKIKTQYELYQDSKSRVDILKSYIQTQEELTALYQEEFKLGKRTIINLVDSQQDLKNARVSYINTFIDMVKSTYTIVYATGGLNAALQDTALQDAKFVALNEKKL